VAGYGLVPFSELVCYKAKKEEESLVKCKSSDMYVGRPNYNKTKQRLMRKI